MSIGLCKHLLATSSFIYGQVTSFGQDAQIGLPDKLDKIMRRASKYAISGDPRNPKVEVRQESKLPPQVPAPETPEENPNVNPQNAQNRQNTQNNQPTEESYRTRVDKGGDKPMNNLKNLKNARKLIEELEASEPIMPDHEFGGVGDSPSPEQPEGKDDEALDLLHQIADHLATLVDAEIGDEAGEAEAEVADDDGLSDEDFGEVEAPGDEKPVDGI
jgi:hypothetical protein